MGSNNDIEDFVIFKWCSRCIGEGSSTAGQVPASCPVLIHSDILNETQETLRSVQIHMCASLHCSWQVLKGFIASPREEKVKFMILYLIFFF